MGGSCYFFFFIVNICNHEDNTDFVFSILEVHGSGLQCCEMLSVAPQNVILVKTNALMLISKFASSLISLDRASEAGEQGVIKNVRICKVLCEHRRLLIYCSMTVDDIHGGDISSYLQSKKKYFIEGMWNIGSYETTNLRMKSWKVCPAFCF